ncbi:MAG: homoserine dehydrogenase [Candidatus Kapabacteria bacterium]|nr:homoserine dehydrogenase [Candidatus Kapabacteria bacterium]
MSNKLKIGLFGYGIVGQGFKTVLDRSPNLNAEIVKICVKNNKQTEERNLVNSLLTFNAEEIFSNPEIDIIIEAIDDAEFALVIAEKALQNGKSLVTANKKMIAENFEKIFQLQQKYWKPILYEAACCASIPIIRNLEEYYDNDLINSVEGIFNGSTNYILTNMFDNGKSYAESLKEAQEKGFAESNPKLDVEGYDSKYKLTIVIAHAFGEFINPKEIFNFGINKINDFDIKYCNEKGLKIKLIAKSYKIDNKIYAYVFPKFTKINDRFFQVEAEKNGVSVESVFLDKQFFIGKGAGGIATGSALLADVSALKHNYKYEYKKKNGIEGFKISNEQILKAYIRFDNDKAVNKPIFHNIEETYTNGNTKYIIGEIYLDKFIESGLAKREDVNIVLC